MPAERHPIADLLTREERERVLQYEWELVQGPWNFPVLRSLRAGRWWSPLGVMVPMRTGRHEPIYQPDTDLVMAYVLVGTEDERHITSVESAEQLVEDFNRLCDTGQIAPADLAAVLGLDSEEPK